MRIADAHSVFDHHADSEKVNELRATVIQDIYDLYVRKVLCDRLPPNDLAQMRQKYRSLLYYGTFGLPVKRRLANELIWKWTEATGKYVGCQFWSVEAKKLFDGEVEAHGGWPITAKLVKALERKLSVKSSSNDLKLTHEHVYPIADIRRWFSHQADLSPAEIQKHLETHCVGCVVLESEHTRTPGTDENPWLRYRSAGIHLAPNPAWSDTQRALINEAGLVENL